MIELMEHNIRPYNELCEVLKTSDRCAVISATGTGKSYIAAKYADEYFHNDRDKLPEKSGDNISNNANKADKPMVLVVVPSKEIRSSWSSLLPDATVITYQALERSGDNARKKLFSGCFLIIFDEMHHLGADVWGECVNESLDDYTGKYIGLTATPIRYLDDFRDMTHEFFGGNMVRGVELPEAIDKGILPSFDYTAALYSIPKFKKTKESMTSLLTELDILSSRYQVKNVLKQHILADGNAAADDLEDAGNSEIAGNSKISSNLAASKSAVAKKVCVFVNKLANIDQIRSICKDVFPDALHIELHSKMSHLDAKKARNEFQNADRTAFLYTVDMLNEGVHIKGVDTIIMFRKTKSPIVYLQQLGRVLSSDMAGRRVTIIDFVANHTNLIEHRGLGASTVGWIKGEIENPDRQIVINDYALSELEIIEKLKSLQNDMWSYEEDEILRDGYAKKLPLDEIAKNLDLFQHRTKAGIKLRAHVLGLSMKSCARWTDEEMALLEENKDLPVSKLRKLLPEKSESGIRKKKREIGGKPSRENLVNDEAIINTVLEHINLTAKEIRGNYLPDVSENIIYEIKKRYGKSEKNSSRKSVRALPAIRFDVVDKNNVYSSSERIAAAGR